MIERPELKREDEVEKNILHFTDSIAYSYEQKLEEYMQFITSDSANADEVMTVLNMARLLQRLYTVTKEYVNSDETEDSSVNEFLCNAEAIKTAVGELQSYIYEVMEAIKKEHDNILDDDDYLQKTQDIYSRRKKFRTFSNLCNAYFEILDSFSSESTPVHISADIAKENSHDFHIPEKTPETVKEITDEMKESTSSDILHLTESDFRKWLVENCNMLRETATNYIRLIHNIELLYEDIFGIKKVLFGDVSAEETEEMIRTIIQTKEYAKTNKINRGFKPALEKYSMYAGIDVSIFKNREKLRAYSSSVSSSGNESSQKITADLDHCIYYDQSTLSSYSFKGQVQSVQSWNDIFSKFVFQLYIDSDYRETIIDMIGKTLDNGEIYLADSAHLVKFRQKLYIAPDLYGEGKLSDTDIIKRIKHIIKLCSIDNDILMVEYTVP